MLELHLQSFSHKFTKPHIRKGVRVSKPERNELSWCIQVSAMWRKNIGNDEDEEIGRELR